MSVTKVSSGVLGYNSAPKIEPNRRSWSSNQTHLFFRLLEEESIKAKGALLSSKDLSKRLSPFIPTKRFLNRYRQIVDAICYPSKPSSAKIVEFVPQQFVQNIEANKEAIFGNTVKQDKWGSEEFRSFLSFLERELKPSITLQQLSKKYPSIPFKRFSHKYNYLQRAVVKALEKGQTPKVSIKEEDIAIPAKVVKAISSRTNTNMQCKEKLSLKSRECFWLAKDDEALLNWYIIFKDTDSFDWSYIAEELHCSEEECEEELKNLINFAKSINPKLNAEKPTSKELETMRKIVKEKKSYPMWYKENTVKLLELLSESSKGGKRGDFVKVAAQMSELYGGNLTARQCTSRVDLVKSWALREAVSAESYSDLRLFVENS